MSPAPTDKTIALDGLAIRYLEAGEGRTIVLLDGAGLPLHDAAFIPLLAARHRLLIPATDALDAARAASFIARVAGGKAHVVTQGAGAVTGTWLAILHPDLVESLVLSAPEPADADLLARLDEVKVPALLLCGAADPLPAQEAALAYQERIASVTRILIHGAAHDAPLAAAPSWARLVADFVDRGEFFVVNPGG
jgi:pimeloyl-ACP methyl ester carboxylesterase